MRSGTVLESPERLQSVRAHGTEVSCADAWGARLVTGGGRELRMWAWRAGTGWEPGVCVAAHRYGVTAVRWSRCGALVASGGVDGALRVWAASHTRLGAVRVLSAPGAAAVRAVCWAGGAALGAHADGAVCVWRVHSGTLAAVLRAHEGAVHALAAPGPHGALLLTCCDTGMLKVFDLHEVCRRWAAGSVAPAPLLWEDGAHDLGALCADAARRGTLAATGGQDARVRVWRVGPQGGGLVAAEVLVGHGAGVTALRWGARDTLASASLDRTARVWRRGTCLAVLRAHERYLTAVVLDPLLRYMLTGSNDRTVRTWSLGAFTLEDELEEPCDRAAHFAIGDLEGIEQPVDLDDMLEPTLNGNVEPRADGEESGGARLVWESDTLHSGAINSIAVYKDLVATASSDGTVRTMRWSGSLEQMCAGRVLEPGGGGGGGSDRGYPVLAADLGAAGDLLLSAGLDGAARLHDVQSGAALRTVLGPSAGEEGAGSGVRGARVSPHRPPLLLLATDSGRAPLWSLADPDPHPLHVYDGHEAAALCCAWGGALVCATGGEGGELVLHAAPPCPRTLAHAPAHDLGVQSCDFAPSSSAVGLRDEDQLMLATAGSDSFVKLWLVQLDKEWDESSGARLSLLASVAAHGGGATCVRWACKHTQAHEHEHATLASGGADRWARAWHVRVPAAAGGDLEPGEEAGGAGAGLVRAAGAVPTNGAVAVAMLGSDLLVLGTMTGSLAVWRLPPGAEEDAGGGGDGGDEGEDGEELVETRWWGEAGVLRWLRENVTRVPGAVVPVSAELEVRLCEAVRALRVTGVQLLTSPTAQLLRDLQHEVNSESGECEEGTEMDKNEEEMPMWERLREELAWLRSDPPRDELVMSVPHALRCAATHVVPHSPVRAADGFTYERAALAELRLITDEVVSPVTGRRMRNARVSPNYKLRDQLRTLRAQHEHDTDDDDGDE